VEPVAGIPHGGFYEGGRTQEAPSPKARPYPPHIKKTSEFTHRDFYPALDMTLYNRCGSKKLNHSPLAPISSAR
jgi:hypothetical protein